LIVGLKQSNEGLIDDGMQYARKAVELGHKFSAPEDAPRVFAYPYSEFSSDPRFLGVLAMPESGREATSADRMIMPAYLRDFARPR
jgi:hypothetical protein